jgi:hypothetical protein
VRLLQKFGRVLCKKHSVARPPTKDTDGDWLQTVLSAHVFRTALTLLADLLRLLRLMFRSQTQLAAENLFLRKQLACYIERQVRPRRTDDASRIALALLAQIVEWRELLTIVRPETLVRWHRKCLSPLLSPQVPPSRAPSHSS